MNLSDILCRAHRAYPNHPALIMRMGYRTITLTYQQVYELAHATALFLEAQGIRKGDCVVVCAPNSPYWACLFWGCMIQGAVIVPLNIQSTDEMIAKIIKQTEARIYFTAKAAKFLDTERENSVKVYTLALLDELVAEYMGKQQCYSLISSDDLMQILYTSGTTGEPKGVMLTHKNLMSNVESVNKIFDFTSKDARLLSVLPLSHIFEQTIGFLAPFSRGATIVYAHNHAAIQSLLKEYHITIMLVVPEFLKVLLARIMDKVHESWFGKMSTSLMNLSMRLPWWMRRLLFRPILKQLGGHLQLVASGGAPLDPHLEQCWNALGVKVIQGYGLTETSPLVSGNVPERRAVSVGKPVPGVSVRLASDHEIQVMGDNVFQGYFKNQDKTREVFTEDGWFMTGDMGEFDADGFLFIRGRKKYMIKGPGAQNIYPEDIEEVLNQISGVKDSCVIGLEHPGGAVQIHAVLLLQSTLPANEIEELITKANAQLASYQHIGGWTVWQDEDFPRSATRKVKKDEVKSRIKVGDDGESNERADGTSKLVALVAQVAGVSARKITPKTLIVRHLHMDSLMTVELLARIEQSFNVAVEGWIIGPTTTLEELQRWIDEGVKVPKPRSLKAWPRSWWACALRFVLQPLALGFVRFFVKVNVKGLENLNTIKTPVIFMPNHVSQIDPILLAKALPAKIRRRISFASAQDVLYKEYRFWVPLSELLFYAFPFPRKENENIVQGLTLMGQVLEHGYSVVLFPEGKISLDGQLQPLKQGAGLVATQMMVPVVPVMLHGVHDIIGPDGLFPSKRGEITICFGKPLTISRMLSLAQATDEVEKAMHEVAR